MPPPAPAPLQPPPPQMGAAAPPARPGAGPGTGYSLAAPTPAPAPGRMPGGPGGMAANAEQLLGKFQALSMGPVGPAAPGQPQQNVSIDPNEFPRPTGPQVDQLLGPQETDPLACDPRHVRMTVHAVPQSAELRKRWQLPYGAIIHPMAKLEEPVPVVSFGAAGVLRCRRCRAYINPYVQFLDGGRRWACNFCGQPNDVPVEYFCALDHQGKRKDLAERPELLRGAVEFVAPAEYMVRPPMPPTYVFLIDVSHAAVVSGAVHTALQGIKANLDRLPGDTRTQVGFVTFDSTVHFYRIRQGASGPAMLVASDLEDMFLPTPEDLVVNLSENREAVEATIYTIGKAFEGTQKSESCLGAALQGAFLAMEKVGGKLQLFCTSPATKGPGKMKPGRDNSSLYGGEKEHTLRCPDDPFWRNFGTECSKNQISVDVFCSAGQFTDVASIAGAAHWSGGQVYYYPGFNAVRDGPKMFAELGHNLSRETGWEAVMRIRMGKGLRVSSFHGHFVMRSSDLMSLPIVDQDKAFAVQIGHDEQLLNGPVTYMQSALLYTSSSGERRIRVHTLAIPIVNDLSQLYKAADGAASAALLARLGVEKAGSSRLADACQAVQHKTVGALREYRMMYSAQLHAQNKLVFPENLRLLPVLCLGAVKSAALRGGSKDVMPDERAATAFEALAMDVDSCMRFLYPRVFALHTIDVAGGSKVGLLAEGGGGTVLPAPIPASMELLSPEGLYLVDNGRLMIVWVGRAASADLMQSVFGVGPDAAPEQLGNLQVEPARDNELSRRVAAIIQAQRGRRGVHQLVFVVRQGDPLEAHVKPYFVEDRQQASMSYLEFLAHVHKSVMAAPTQSR